MREDREHNLQLGFSSQRLGDMSEGITSQVTGRFVVLAGGEKEAKAIISRFELAKASAGVVRYGLNEPGPGRAPFLVVSTLNNAKYKQLLVNSFGLIELWALLTTLGDISLQPPLRTGPLQLRTTPFCQDLPTWLNVEENRVSQGRASTAWELDTRAEMGAIDAQASELVDGREHWYQCCVATMIMAYKMRYGSKIKL